MGNIIIRHGQDRELSDRPVPPLHPPGPLVDRGQIRVHVPGVPSAPGDLLAGGGDLAEGVGVGGHVREDHEDVLLPLVGEVLRGGEGQAGGDDALDGGVVGEVQEQDDVLHGAVLLKIVLKKPCRLHVHPHGPEHNRKIIRGVVLGVLLLHQPGLPADLGGDLVVGQAGGGEQGELLPAHDTVHGVQGGDPGLDHLLGVDTRLGVDGGAVDIQVVLGEHRRPLVQGLPRPVEGPADHLVGDGHLEGVSGELHVGVLVVNAGGALEHLHHGLAVVHLQHLALSYAAVSQCQVDDLRKAWELHIVQNHQRSLNTRDGLVVNSWGNLVVPGGGSGLRC
mmetsp:Transcript_62503/g.167417  ORF Transcript_62503/g.167417 Transcript_62503/m.167417 type:complete len:335 (+) Transcript_62503:537-1541(+)